MSHEPLYFDRHDRPGHGAPLGSFPADSAGPPSAEPVLIDCASCAVRDVACHDCVITALLGGEPDGPYVLDDVERGALGSLAEVGLVPVLRHLPRRGTG